VPLHESRDIKLWLLENLDLANVAVLDREDARGFFCDLFSNRSGNELLNEGFKVSLVSQFGHSRNHLCSNGTSLRGLGVARALDLILLRFCESNAKQAHHVSVGGTAINISFDNGLLLTDQTAKLITGHVHSVEVEEAVVSLNIFDTELNFAVSKCLILVQVGKRHLNNTSLEVFGGNLGTLGLGDEGLSSIFDSKNGRGNQVVPFLLEEGVNCLLTATLLTLRQSLVLSLLMTKGTGVSDFVSKAECCQVLRDPTS
jgi:hypothetical protein